jgi:hypothetical protein
VTLVLLLASINDGNFLSLFLESLVLLVNELLEYAPLLIPKIDSQRRAADRIKASAVCCSADDEEEEEEEEEMEEDVMPLVGIEEDTVTIENLERGGRVRASIEITVQGPHELELDNEEEEEE